MLNVVTGATGLLGSHVAEQLVGRGERVRALVRPTSDVSFLQELGVEIVPCDLGDASAVRQAVAGADVLYHCAARVGDWGTWAQFRADVLDATRNILDACRLATVGRVLHVSSLAVYGHPGVRSDAITEQEPLGQRLGLWEYYSRVKILAEELARQHGSGLTIVRPGWMFGPRDRQGLPRLVQALRGGWVSLLDSGDNPLNILYAADVADGAIRAATNPIARGQVYHLSGDGTVTQRQFYDAITGALSLPPVTRRVPYRLAYWGGFCGEVIARAFRWQRAPFVSRYSVALVGRSASFSTEKARTHLGWQAQVPPLEGLHRTLDWLHLDKRLPVGKMGRLGKLT
jgi:nucleoside-diphosphate-sugar epimerase